MPANLPEPMTLLTTKLRSDAVYVKALRISLPGRRGNQPTARLAIKDGQHPGQTAAKSLANMP